MKLIVKKGRTSLLVKVFIQDTSKTDGSGLTGLTSGSSGLICYRARDDDGNAAATQLSLSGGTKGTWSSGGFVEKDATHMPGFYELGLDNAGLVTGSETAVYMLSGATNMAPLALEIQLVAYDPQDAVRLGLTALPNVSSGSAGAVITAGTGANQITTSSGQVTVATNNDKTGYTVSTVSDKTGYSITGNVTVGGYAAGQDPMTLVALATLAESYAGSHVTPTMAQLLYELRAFLAERSVVGVTMTTKKIDGATTAHTYTLNDPSNPSSTTTAS